MYLNCGNECHPPTSPILKQHVCEEYNCVVRWLRVTRAPHFLDVKVRCETESLPYGHGGITADNLL